MSSACEVDASLKIIYIFTESVVPGEANPQCGILATLPCVKYTGADSPITRATDKIIPVIIPLVEFGITTLVIVSALELPNANEA